MSKREDIDDLSECPHESLRTWTRERTTSPGGRMCVGVSPKSSHLSPGRVPGPQATASRMKIGNGQAFISVNTGVLFWGAAASFEYNGGGATFIIFLGDLFHQCSVSAENDLEYYLSTR